MNQRFISNVVSTACVLTLVLTGCGGPGNVGKVSGTVTLDGQPLDGAMVTFTAKDSGNSIRGVTDSQGIYNLTYSPGVMGAELGEHTVSITTRATGDPDGDPPTPSVPEKVPLKYNLESDLKRTVEKGSNVFDFELELDGPVVQPDAADKMPKRQGTKR